MTTKCDNCGKEVPDECIERETEREEFWGAPAYYEIIVRYRCPHCDYEWES